MNLYNVKSEGLYTEDSSSTLYLGDTQNKIRSFAELQRGWNFGEGSKISRRSIARALQVHKRGSLLGLDSEASPEINGGVSLSFFAGQHSLLITINPDLKTEVIHEVGIGIDFEEVEVLEDIGLYELQKILEHLQEFKKKMHECDSLEFSILNTTTVQKDEDFRATRSESTKVESQYLVWIVPVSNMSIPYAII